LQQLVTVFTGGEAQEIQVCVWDSKTFAPVSVMLISSPPETYHRSHRLIKYIRFRHKTQAFAKSKAFRQSQIKHMHLAEEKHLLFK